MKIITNTFTDLIGLYTPTPYVVRADYLVSCAYAAMRFGLLWAKDHPKAAILANPADYYTQDMLKATCVRCTEECVFQLKLVEVDGEWFRVTTKEENKIFFWPEYVENVFWESYYNAVDNTMEPPKNCDAFLWELLNFEHIDL